MEHYGNNNEIELGAANGRGLRPKALLGFVSTRRPTSTHLSLNGSDASTIAIQNQVSGSFQEYINSLAKTAWVALVCAAYAITPSTTGSTKTTATISSRTFIRDVTYGGFKVYILLTAGTICLFAIGNGVIQLRLERIYPTPHDWRFFTRWEYRIAAALEDDEGKGSPVDWSEVGPKWRDCLARLEEVNKVDGQGLERIDKGLELKDVPIWDARKKSEQWRRGYFEVVMGCGRAAEHLLGWYQDVTRPLARPVRGDVIVGPSNLDPRPLPPGQGPPPREEDCKPVMEAPDAFYQRIIRSKGFSRKQQLLATLALADYLDFQGSHADAEHYHRDALDLACSALHEPENHVDVRTGAITGKASAISSNVLAASTALAVHYARTANTAAALPIFLSALRTIRESNHGPDSINIIATSAPTNPPKGRSTMNSVIDYLKDHPYPAPRSTGDEPLATPSGSCLEASLLAYIGEILFVTAKNGKDRARGIAWTKDAADLAESRVSQILQAQAAIEKTGNAQNRFLAERNENDVQPCRECLELGLTNLQRMIEKMMQIAGDGAEDEQKSRGWYAWLGGGSKATTSGNRWEQEQEKVDARLEKLRDEQLQNMMQGRAGGRPFGLPRLI
ncbi:MAG: hypothetical protein M1822_000948 [Bathelium mastoideum]|nr:MAG: hypothetical protein M1822_000948 [Bathelium mastoideum]